jgi:opacity protein-like surface antigen
MLKHTIILIALAALLATSASAADVQGLVGATTATTNTIDLTIANSPSIKNQESRKSAQFKKWHWYELSDAQHDKMVAALKAIKSRQPVNVLCGDPDCRDLAKDFVDAFEGAGWTARTARAFTTRQNKM